MKTISNEERIRRVTRECFEKKSPERNFISDAAKKLYQEFDINVLLETEPTDPFNKIVHELKGGE